MHIANQKLSYNTFTEENLQNVQKKIKKKYIYILLINIHMYLEFSFIMGILTLV